ncbi:ATP-dependent DNA ligase [Kineosporia sp. NBRC 101677]|nr:ATP-dependent DNA ligase [Kineosporia sp. NBRC 101677]
MGGMDLPVMPPVKPMLAKSVPKIPDVGHVEPKWDGFRTIVFRDGDEVELGSRNEKPMTRYFPELVEALRQNLPPRCVVDGEIVTIVGDRLQFEVLQQRIHPAASRIQLLSEQTPASFIAFDLLALGDENLMEQPFSQRRARLVEALSAAKAPVYCTPATTDLDTGQEWFGMFEGAGLDGVVAKPLDGPYEPNQRSMFKIKHARTADCVVAGFRWHKSGPIVGSLLLGLYREDGSLQHVGVAASFPMARRAELVQELEPYRMAVEDLGTHPWGKWAEAQAHEHQRMPGNVSRWNSTKDLSFVPLRPDLVVEVAYDQMEGDRFRHTAQFRRWRTDRTPDSCGYEQLERPVNFRLEDVLSPVGSKAPKIVGD